MRVNDTVADGEIDTRSHSIIDLDEYVSRPDADSEGDHDDMANTPDAGRDDDDMADMSDAGGDDDGMFGLPDDGDDDDDILGLPDDGDDDDDMFGLPDAGDDDDDMFDPPKWHKDARCTEVISHIKGLPTFHQSNHTSEKSRATNSSPMQVQIDKQEKESMCVLRVQ